MGCSFLKSKRQIQTIDAQIAAPPPHNGHLPNSASLYVFLVQVCIAGLGFISASFAASLWMPSNLEKSNRCALVVTSLGEISSMTPKPIKWLGLRGMMLQLEKDTREMSVMNGRTDWRPRSRGKIMCRERRKRGFPRTSIMHHLARPAVGAAPQ